MKTNKHRMTVSSYYNIYPVITGGQHRIYHLYKNLARLFDISLFTYSDYGISGYTKYLAPSFWEHNIPLSMSHHMKQEDLRSEYGRLAYKYSIMNLFELTPDYLILLEESIRRSEVTVVSHSFTFPVVKKAGAERIWYDAHNVEYELNRMIVDNAPRHIELLEQIKQVEKECCNTSELIMVCSEQDRLKMTNLYKIDPRKVIVVPNGSDMDNIACVLPDKRHKLRKAFGILTSFNAFFIGSYFETNIEAVEQILKLAKQLCDVMFVIAGDVCNCLAADRVPSNVRLEGRIDDQRKAMLLSTCDVALNPMLQGSGTNLKMLEYFAYGIPVITTPVGARGLNVENRRHCIICDIDDFAVQIRRYMRYNMEFKVAMAKEARLFIGRNFNWKNIARNAGNQMLHLLENNS